MTLENFNENLKKYARLIAETGVNVQDNHTVVLQISVDQAPLARLITEEAYRLGAAEVIVQWSDETIQREFLAHAATDRIENVPQYKIDQTDDWIAKGASRISVVSSNPDALAGVDAQRVAAFQAANGKALVNLRKATQANKVSWTVVAALHYTAPGTDLTIGLPKNHLWEGAGSYNARGEEFMANMPTEEVFTAPDSRRVDGYVSSTKPLSYAGTIISGMKFTFKDGKVVDFSAEQGEEALKNLLAIDEGAKHLGEVALVPDPSPISQSGLIFYNTLFDENASNHLAFGSAYAFNLQGGTEMSEEELAEAGLNRSQTHVDFMVGSDKMNIDGIKEDGTIVPVFRNGDWA